LWSHPLMSFLHNRAPFPLPVSSPYLPDTALNDVADEPHPQFNKQDEKYAGPPPPKSNSTEYHSFHDMPWGPTSVRIHSFLTGRESSGTKPIAGLTASILLEVAQIGYGRVPEGFEIDAPGQAGRRERIAWEMNRSKRFIEALKREGVRWDWKKEESRERHKREAANSDTKTKSRL
jgi:peroxisomal coenzyme A diphosphatase NUDT7